MHLSVGILSVKLIVVKCIICGSKYLQANNFHKEISFSFLTNTMQSGLC